MGKKEEAQKDGGSAYTTYSGESKKSFLAGILQGNV